MPRITYYFVFYLCCIFSIFKILMMIVSLLFFHKEGIEAVTLSFLVLFNISLISLISIKMSKKTDIALTFSKISFLLFIAWAFSSLCASLPFLFSGMKFTDAWFESVSGLTTTGASIISKPENMTHTILLWRSLIQCIGGFGIITTVTFLFHILRINRKISILYSFKELISEKNTKILALNTLFIYSMLTILCTYSYYIFGMNIFHAICHAMTTVSTGGFSTHSKSINYFQNTYVDIIAIPFMLIAATPMILFADTQKTSIKIRNYIHNKQVRIFFIITIIMCIIPFFYWNQIHSTENNMYSIRSSIFNIVSAITGTGFVMSDFSKWPEVYTFIIIIALIIGGCSHSSACSIKIFRHHIMWQKSMMFLKYWPYPHIYYKDKKEVYDNYITMIFNFSFLFIISILILSGILIFTGVDISTALLSVISMITNYGPHLAPHIGSLSSYDMFSDTQLFILSLTMLLGRLEIYTIIIGVLFIINKKFD